MLTEFLYGAYKTLSLAFTAWVFGLPLGIIFSFFSLRFPKYSFYLSSLSVVLTVLPFLAILFWFHYPLQNILDVVWSPYFTSAFLLAIFVAIISGEIVAEEMRKTKKDFIDSVDVLGIRKDVFLMRVVFPTAIINALPRLLNLSVVSIHMTMFASLIGVEELFRITLRLNSEYLQPVKIFSIMALFYACICLPLYFLANRLSEKLNRNNHA